MDLMLALCQQGDTTKCPRILRPSVRGKAVDRLPTGTPKPKAKPSKDDERDAAAERTRRRRERQAAADRKQALLREKRKRLGLTAIDGFVQPSTKVLQTELIDNSEFRESVLFRKPPFSEWTDVPLELIGELRVLEDKILSMARSAAISAATMEDGGCSEEGENGVTPQGAVDAAKTGWLGAIDVGGVIIENAKVKDGDPKSVHGFIHGAPFLEGDPHTRQLLYDCVRRILNAAFAHQKWYRAQVMLTERLTEESGERRTIPGLPFSSLRLTQHSKEESFLFDENAVGFAVVLTTGHGKGPGLVLINDTKHKQKVLLVPGMLLAGRWAQNPHCYRNVSTAAEFPTSWAFHLDYRVFFRDYACVEQK